MVLTFYISVIYRNQETRVQWCSRMLSTKENFKNVVFTDETTVEMNSCGRTRFYKISPTLDSIPRKAPKPKHAYKVQLHFTSVSMLPLVIVWKLDFDIHCHFFH